jgi:glycerophosphoryl diester phosphodiesterase
MVHLQTAYAIFLLSKTPTQRSAMRLLFRPFAVVVGMIVLVALAGCQSSPQTPKSALLTGRAILPADTFSPGPPVGHQVEGPVNGRALPFAQTPVQGFSSLIPLGDDRFIALQDNGFGARANSPDYPLRWYEITLDLTSGKPEGGPVTIDRVVTLSDPDQHAGFPLAQADTSRTLTGGDFDPESFVRLEDGTFWVGEEFGPFLLHFDAQGRLLEAPVPVLVPGPLRPYNKGSYFLRSVDHPEIRNGAENRSAEELANLPPSGGIEGLALGPGEAYLYLAVEKAMIDDPDPARRTILEFDPTTRRFTARFWFLHTDEPGHCLAALEHIGGQHFLVVERDDAQGPEARFKRVFRFDLDHPDEKYFVEKGRVCDLLDIRDSFGYSAAKEGAFGLGPRFSFPFVTTESLVVLDATTLLLCNDNNYPFSTGRRTDAPDDTEFIRLQLPEPLLR